MVGAGGKWWVLKLNDVQWTRVMQQMVGVGGEWRAVEGMGDIGGEWGFWRLVDASASGLQWG